MTTTLTAPPRPRRARLPRPALPAHRPERDAFREHLLASAWSGLSGGLVGLTDIILAKTLGAPGWQITLLATLAPAANLTSFWWAGQVDGRGKAGYFLLAALFGRLPLLLVLAVGGPWTIIALNFVYAVATALLVTAVNAVLQRRYAEADRARWFGWSVSASALCSILAVQSAGWLLQRREDLYPWIYAVAGVAGLASSYHLFRMEAGGAAQRNVAAWLRGGWRSLGRRIRPEPRAGTPGWRASVRLFREILRENPGFVRFERSFMIYGFAFLSVVPVLPLYVVHELRMSYPQLSATKGIWSQIGLLLLSPVLGAWLGRVRPLLFAGRSFLLLSLYPGCLLVSTLPGTPARIAWVYLALFFFSVAMTGVNLSWTLGSMHFAGRRDASAFQGVHVAMTGVRGLIAPGAGFLLYRAFGSAAVFGVSTALFLWAGTLMLRQDREERRGIAGAGGAAAPR